MTTDAVNHPAHYTQGGIECIDAIEAALTPEEFAGFCKGNALKYVWRAGHKGSVTEDLRKAGWYLDRLTGDQSIAAGASTLQLHGDASEPLRVEHRTPWPSDYVERDRLPLQCDYDGCGIIFPTQDELDAHIEGHYPDASPQTDRNLCAHGVGLLHRCGQCPVDGGRVIWHAPLTPPE